MLKRIVLIGSLGLWSAGCSGGGSESGETACADAPGVICTWAGSGELGYNGDGLALRDSDLYWPVGLTFADDDTGDELRSVLVSLPAPHDVLTVLDDAEAVLAAARPVASDGHELDDAMERVQSAMTRLDAAIHARYVAQT